MVIAHSGQKRLIGRRGIGQHGSIQHGPNGLLAQHGRQAAHMVAVRVCERQHVHAVDAAGMQIRHDDPLADIRAVFRPGFIVDAAPINHHGSARRRFHHDAVALADIQHADAQLSGVRVRPKPLVQAPPQQRQKRQPRQPPARVLAKDARKAH